MDKRKLQQTFGSTRFARIHAAGHIDFWETFYGAMCHNNNQDQLLVGNSTTTDASPPPQPSLIATQEEERVFWAFPQMYQELEQLFHYLGDTFDLVMPEQMR
jgi:hypothetical protein